MSSPEACPRFDACSANVCPLDPDWPKRRHVPDEAVCAYLIDAAKPGGPERVRELLPDGAGEMVLRAAPEIARRHPSIARELRRAASRRSRMAWGQKLASGRAGDDAARECP